MEKSVRACRSMLIALLLMIIALTSSACIKASSAPLNTGSHAETARSDSGNPFSDVAEDAYYFDAVMWAVRNGVTAGTSETTFSPKAGCTRAQAVTFLWRAAGQPEPAECGQPFADVNPGAYYEKAVLWATKAGITVGTSETTFSPKATCTRAQIATFLWRLAGAPEPAEQSIPFEDVEPGAYYEKAVLWAVQNGVTAGTSETTFSPKATCTRAQIVTFLYRYCMNHPETPKAAIAVSKIEELPEDFFLGVDISSLLSVEASGRVFYDFDGQERDLFEVLQDSGVNCIRVRVWNDPFDENGNGYGGGNCTVDTAIALGLRAKAHGMGLLVDFHYSDFWADPGKQQAPKAWADFTIEEKAAAIYAYTADGLQSIRESGVSVDMVQIGNEITGGLCGETEKEAVCSLLCAAAQAVRDTDPDIRIVVHYTNPERKNYAEYTSELQARGVDYDVFATSYYPEYHGTMENLTEQLQAVHALSGKQVMIAETSWSHTSDDVGPYKHSVQGQADEIAACVKAMCGLGGYGIGVFWWEPAWLDVPGHTEAEREQYGVSWATSYAVSYDPVDAGQYYGGAPNTDTALFDPEGHPLESLKTFRYLREGSGFEPTNYLRNASFEESDSAAWRITEAVPGTVEIQDKPSDARDGNKALHFWCADAVAFTAEQTVSGLPEGEYSFSISAQGDGIGEDAVLKIFAVSDGVRYERSFILDGWLNWKVPMLEAIPCSGGTLTVGVEILAAPGAWGTVDCAELLPDREKAAGNE